MTIVKILFKEDWVQKKRPDWVKPIREYETSKAVWEFMKNGYIHRIDRRMLPKIKGRQFMCYETQSRFRRGKEPLSILYLIYAPSPAQAEKGE